MTEAARPGGVYRAALARGTLAFQRCGRCASAVFFPRVLCPVCGSTSLSFEESARRGIVYAVTTVHPRNAKAYTLALVDVDEGFRVMAALAGFAPDSSQVIGTRVEIAVRDGEQLVAVRGAQ